MVEAIVEEELTEERERREEEGAEDGVGGAGRVRGVVGDVAEAELGDVDGFVGGGVYFGEVAANDAVWGGGAEVAGEDGPPGDAGVDGVEDPVRGFLLGGVEGGGDGGVVLLV